ncbi:VanZ family protein [Paenisporosarcina sp.]|uniref:VanZ family protein n=1 Tax=Paenisporosarcina sp. TaxID=1932001 RepID=UPI003C71E43D
MFFRILTGLWAVMILVGSCTSDPQLFIYNQYVNFDFQSAINFRDLFIISDFQLTSTFFLFQKVGHFAGFALLFFLLFNWIKSYRFTFVLCVIFALLTEVLQLYFNRNGRLYDVGVDSIGLVAGYLMCHYFYTKATLKKDIV